MQLASKFRFQYLGEFDAEKRSCRKRLEGHNRRRRKPQPKAFYMSSGSYSSNHQDSSSCIYNGVDKRFPFLLANDPERTNQVVSGVPIGQRLVNNRVSPKMGTDSSSCIYNGVDKRFPFLLANDPERTNQVVSGVPIGQRLVNNRVSPKMGTGHQKILSYGLTQSVNSERALSLLSSHLLQWDAIHPNQPPPMVPHHVGNANNLWKETFQVAPHDLFENEASQVLPFFWT
ncbi:hypothetical protein U1Q18_012595 [Sarracenia purpurea var. burkii]